MATPWTSSSSAARTTASTERSWPRCTTSAPWLCSSRRITLIAASCPSNRLAAVTKRTGWVGTCRSDGMALRRRVVRRVAERALVPGHVVPAAELPAHPAVGAHELEAHRRVQPDARVVGQRDAGERGPVAAGGQPVGQGRVEGTAGAGTATTGLDVDADRRRPG